MVDIRRLAEAAEAAGLRLRGGFALDAADRVGALVDARAIVLLGFAGSNEWPAFADSPEARDGAPHPLDRWSRRVVGGLAAAFGAHALFPFEGPPYWPFQAWAQRAEPVAPSPLGLMIHPVYGLSHSYRGALAFGEIIALESPASAHPPCAACPAPCLGACPVNAFTRAGYDVARCAAWLRAPEGRECRERGCLARRACPVGPTFAQTPQQARFHMAAFLAAR